MSTHNTNGQRTAVDQDNEIVSSNKQICGGVIHTGENEVGRRFPLVAPYTFRTLGAIVRLTMKNFMIHTNMTYYPCPNLNVFIGPNGTGKSTVVCALCLGLAGKASVMGRSSKVNEFIKRGCTEAVIEIELHNPSGPNFVISRKINSDKISSWCIGKKPHPQKDVEELVGKLHIQVDNLCQFLPQEKLLAFARMNPQMLLENTEKAVGEPLLHQQHQQLKTMHISSKEKQAVIKDLVTRITIEEKKNDRIRRDIQAYEERKTCEKNLARLNSHKTILRAKEITAKYIGDKHRCTVYKQHCDQEMLKSKPLEEEIAQTKNDIAELTKKTKEKTASSHQSQKQLRDFSAKKDLVQQKMTQFDNDYKDEVQQHLHRKTKISELNGKITRIQKMIAASESDDSLNAELAGITSELSRTEPQLLSASRNLGESKSDYSRKVTQIKAYENELRRIPSSRSIRCDVLRSKDRDCLTALDWLDLNRQMFKSNIYGPMCLEIDIKDPHYSKYIEDRIGTNDLVAFICEDIADMNLFLTEVREKKKLRVNVIHSASYTVPNLNDRPQIQSLYSLGLEIYLTDVFNTPQAVTNYLCRGGTGLHRIAVGNDQSAHHGDDIASMNLWQYYSPTDRYILRKSEFHDRISTRIDEVREVRYLCVPQSQQRAAELKILIDESKRNLLEMEKCIKTYEQEEQIARNIFTEIRSKKTEVVNKIQVLRNHFKMLETHEKELQKTRNSENNLQDAEKKRKTKKLKVILDRLNQMPDITQEIFLSLASEMELLASSDILDKLKIHLSDKEVEMQEIMVELNNKEKQYQEMTSRLIAFKREVDQLKRESDIAKKSLEGVSDEIPADMTAIDKKIDECRYKIDMLGPQNHQVIAQYRKRILDIDVLKAKKEEQEQEILKLKSDVEIAKREWMPKVEKLIERISSNFGRFFQSMGLVAQIWLDKGHDEENYNNYGIKMQVKFRSSEQILDGSSRQLSGGERAVTVALYMMSLQELTTVPFRCVDEINQGMDETNELRVFELIKETSCVKNSAQYFVISPKLLLDLHYHISSDVIVTCKNSTESINYSDCSHQIYFLKKEYSDHRINSCMGPDKYPEP